MAAARGARSNRRNWCTGVPRHEALLLTCGHDLGLRLALSLRPRVVGIGPGRRAEPIRAAKSEDVSRDMESAQTTLGLDHRRRKRWLTKDDQTER